MVFSEEQIKDLEDHIFNALTPIYAKLDRVKTHGLKQSDVDMMIGRIDVIISYIRALRPKEKRIRG